MRIKLLRGETVVLMICSLMFTACSKWGKLANPEFDRQRIETILFFAGQQLDGRTLEQNMCTALPGNITQGCQTAWPIDQRLLDWTNPANRSLAIRFIKSLGFNTLSMSTWGESWLPCTTECPDVPRNCCGKAAPDAVCSTPIPRCFLDQNRVQQCRIGWYGAANTQLSPAAKNELFEAVVHEPLLIIPFIESRFDFDWNFRTDFPTSLDPRFKGETAPGLISQIKDLISQYITHPRNPLWKDKWAMVYDQHNEKRYAIAIVQASSDSLGPADDQKFAEGFDKVAAQVLEDTQIKVGFFIDPIPRDPDPTNNYGCRVNGRVVSTYAAQFKPDPETTGPWLRKTSSILGIHAYSPEGWIDGPPQTGPPVDECFKREWKKDFSRRWFETGIPFLQDVTPGYDGHILFTSPTGLHTWGYNQSWWNALLGLTSQNGFKGLVYNSWNGYCEGLAGMPTQQQGLNNVNFIRALTRIY